MKNSKIILYTVSTLVSLAVIVYIFFKLDWVALLRILSQINWGWLGLAFIIYFLNIVFRSMRFRALLYSQDASLYKLIPLTSLHNMFVYIMPAKSGDVSYILLSKDRLKIPFSEGAATLLASRLYDFLVVALILACALPFAQNQIPVWIFQSSVVFCAIVLGFSILILYFLRRPRSIPNGTEQYKGVFNYLISSWNKLIDGLREIRARKSHVTVGLLTFGIWLCLYVDYYFMTRALGTPITFPQISMITLVMVPLTLLPLQGFANIGTHEVGWVSVLSVFGYSYQASLTVALGTHFILLITTLFYGGLGFLLMSGLDRK